ncbi:hypothetical protein PoB_002524300 [Plakobranchus ocellatus]|uniref:Uncharacterized protein n=1 Tax=Plakobranchus ocellatus TaxID=259542 RepID=A0AAV3ZWD7_9GAST|nr:hypothetical protein PoB_002524300 [Plakobranchus ocellatus]
MVPYRPAVVPVTRQLQPDSGLKNIMSSPWVNSLSITHARPNGTEGVGGTAASESALISAGILLSRIRAPPPAP